jgi:ferrochelatase
MFASALRHELRDRVSLRVELAMRYGKPSIRNAVERLRVQELKRLIVFPLYPQFAQSSTLTVQKKVLDVLDRIGVASPKPEWFEPFYSDAGYIEAERTVASEIIESFKPDFSLFSFHGVPERHVKRQHQICLTSVSCCDRITADNQNCYRAQCFSTARSIAQALKLNPDQYSVAFQSRLGRTPWIQPFTDVVIQDMPRRGVRRLAVFCPSFVADCLETLDEIENREKDRFLNAGGKELLLVPSLNDHPAWIRAAGELVRRVMDKR